MDTDKLADYDDNVLMIELFNDVMPCNLSTIDKTMVCTGVTTNCSIRIETSESADEDYLVNAFGEQYSMRTI